MAKAKTYQHTKNGPKKRRGIHSKNASKSQTKYKKAYRGQGR